MPLDLTYGDGVFRVAKVLVESPDGSVTDLKSLNVDGVPVFVSDVPMPNLSASVFNYVEYNRPESGFSSAGWDLSEFDTITFDWAETTKMFQPNPNGVASTTSVYLELTGGQEVLVGTASGSLSRIGETYSKNGKVTVPLHMYSKERKRHVRLKVTISNMSAPAPKPGLDRHDATVNISGAIAS